MTGNVKPWRITVKDILPSASKSASHNHWLSLTHLYLKCTAIPRWRDKTLQYNCGPSCGRKMYNLSETSQKAGSWGWRRTGPKYPSCLRPSWSTRKSAKDVEKTETETSACWILFCSDTSVRKALLSTQNDMSLNQLFPNELLNSTIWVCPKMVAYDSNLNLESHERLHFANCSTPSFSRIRVAAVAQRVHFDACSQSGIDGFRSTRANGNTLHPSIQNRQEESTPQMIQTVTWDQNAS